MKVMGYFKTRDEESHFKRNYDEGRIKWNNKIPLNNISKELISLISDQTVSN